MFLILNIINANGICEPSSDEGTERGREGEKVSSLQLALTAGKTSVKGVLVAQGGLIDIYTTGDFCF
jgi:hypothetical protein